MWEKERVEDRGGRGPLWKEIAKLRRLGGDETGEQFPEVVADFVDALLGGLPSAARSTTARHGSRSLGNAESN